HQVLIGLCFQPHRPCHRTQDSRDFHHQFSTESAMHRTDESGGSSCGRSSIPDLEQIISSVVDCIPSLRSSDDRAENMPSPPRTDSKPEVVAENVNSLTAAAVTDTNTTPNSLPIKAPCQNCLAQAEFIARKQQAMRSRRRFSSHPVDAQGAVHISFSPLVSASSRSAVQSEGMDVIPRSAPDRSSFRQSICNPSVGSMLYFSLSHWLTCFCSVFMPSRFWNTFCLGLFNQGVLYLTFS
ncbi:hypothetical protein PHET_08175, partial [Paragonimus heterotremus]